MWEIYINNINLVFYKYLPSKEYNLFSWAQRDRDDRLLALCSVVVKSVQLTDTMKNWG